MRHYHMPGGLSILYVAVLGFYFIYKIFTSGIPTASKAWDRRSFERWKEKNKKYIPIAHAYIYYYMLDIGKDQFNPPVTSYSDFRWWDANRKILMDTCEKLKRGEIPDWEIKLCYYDTIQHLGYEPWAWKYKYL